MTTILEHDGIFWLFTAGTPQAQPIYRKTDDELLVYFSDTPLGPWTPHPMNPVVCDVRGCRPAGRFFYEDGALIRPSQDCSQRYGHAVTLNRVEILTKTQYKEIPIASIGPSWFPGNLGTHAYDRCDTYQVVDGRTSTGSRWARRTRNGYVQNVVTKTEFVRLRTFPQKSAAVAGSLTGGNL